MKKVSVIIPMFNASQTIEECLDSLVDQTVIKDIELIIVDDCSTDCSTEIVKEYENRYPDNIILICLNENAGPGNARNVGIQYATGKYIGFVDSDDAVYPVMYEKLYEEAVNTDADYVDCGYYDQKADNAIVYVSDELAGEMDDHKRSSLIVTGGYIWSKIFKRDFLLSGNISFRNEYVLEDMDFLIECTARAERISNVKEILYVYRNSGSSLSKTDAYLKYIHNQISAMKAIYERTHLLKNYEGIRDAVEFTMLHLYSNVINTCMNAVYLKQQPRETIIPMLAALKELKDAIISGGYDSEYINRGISEKNLMIIRANDISPENTLALLDKN